MIRLENIQRRYASDEVETVAHLGREGRDDADDTDPSSGPREKRFRPRPPQGHPGQGSSDPGAAGTTFRMDSATPPEPERVPLPRWVVPVLALLAVHVAMGAARAHLLASHPRVPRRVRPLDRRRPCHRPILAAPRLKRDLKLLAHRTYVRICGGRNGAAVDDYNRRGSGLSGDWSNG